MHACMHGCKYVCMHVCMYVCMCVCIQWYACLVHTIDVVLLCIKTWRCDLQLLNSFRSVMPRSTRKNCEISYSNTQTDGGVYICSF